MQSSSPFLPSQPASFRAAFASAARFWEPRRILYNLVLATGVVLWVVLTWPHFRPAFTWNSLLFLVVAAALANACYTVAYLIDLPLQHSQIRQTVLLRWSLWLLGTLFALLLETYWIADEIYPFVC